MAYYTTKLGFGCFGASCADIFPPEVPQSLPATPNVPSPVNVNVTVPASPASEAAPTEAAAAETVVIDHAWPWWAWLAVGFGLAVIARD